MKRAAAWAYALVVVVACTASPHPASPSDASTASDAPIADASDAAVDAAVDAPADSVDPLQSSLVVDRTTAAVDTEQVGVTVTLRDGSGEPLAGATVALAATGSADVFSPIAPTDANGVTHATWTSDHSGEETLSATSGGVTFGSAVVAFMPGAAVALAFLVQPTDVLAGEPFSPAVEVAAVDGFGNVASDYDMGEVVIGLGSNPGGTSLHGVTFGYFADSVHSFGNAHVDVAASGYTLVASTSGLPSATSDAFDVVLGDPSMSGSTLTAAPPSQDADGTSPISLVARIANAYGVPLSGVSVAFGASGTGNAFSPPSGISGSDGTVSTTLTSTTAEVETVTATAGSAAIATSVTFYTPGCTPALPGAPWLLMPRFPGPHAFGDVDGDGRADFLVSIGSNFEVHRSLGDGTFGDAIVTPGFTPGGPMVTGDFDNDGKLDLVYIPAPNMGAFAAGTGDGHFGAPVELALAGSGGLSSPYKLLAADFDNDGNLDLAALSSLRFVVVRGNGDGTFTAPITLSTTEDFWDVAAVDVDGNGTRDILLTELTQVTTFLAHADGTFGSGQASGKPMDANAIIPGDFDGDHVADVAIIGQTSGELTLLHGNGDGTFAKPPTAFSVPSYPHMGVAADVDGDGALDLVLAFDGLLYVVHGNGDGTFALGPIYGLDAPSFDFADINDDGRPDLLTVEGTLAGAVLGLPGGELLAPKATPFGDSLYVGADFNGDHRTDLVCYGGDTLNVFLTGSDGSETAEPGDSVYLSDGDGAGIGDLNGDGAPDVVVVDGNIIYSALGGSSGALAPITTQTSSYLTWFQVVDMNGDGRGDLVTEILNKDGIAVALGNGDGTFGSATLYGSYQVNAFAVGDVTGDGVPDVAVAAAGGLLELFEGTGSGTLANPRTYSLPAGFPFAVGIGDVDNDGRSELVVAAGLPVAAAPTQLSLVVMAGSASGFGSAGTWATTPLAPTPVSYLDLSDLTGDGILDVSLGTSTGIQVFSGYGDRYFHVRGAYPLEYAFGDLDGDGQVDAAYSTGGFLVTALQGVCY